jgi:two-component system nitrogen regulation response regulator GlnG
VLLAEFLPAFHPVGAAEQNDTGEESPPLPEAALEMFIDDQLKAGTKDLYAEVLRRVDRLLLTRVLRHTQGNQLQAAKLLGITRGSLRTKLRELGIRIDRSIAGSAEEP